MKTIDIATIKSTNITNDLPDIMESIETSILDDSKSSVEDAVKQLSSCNKKLGKSLTQLNQYMNDVADAFADADQEVSNMIAENTDMFASKSKAATPTVSAGTANYLDMLRLP